jgi:hypothetical protein
MRHWWLISAAMIVAATVAAMCFLPLWTSLSWIDPVTGSTLTEVRIFGAWSLGARQTDSALAKWAARHNTSNREQWQFAGVSEHGAFWTVHGCGPMPPVYALEGKLGEAVVAAVSDEELAALIQVLRAGTEQEKQQAIDSAMVKVFAAKSP